MIILEPAQKDKTQEKKNANKKRAILNLNSLFFVEIMTVFLINKRSISGKRLKTKGSVVNVMTKRPC